MDCVVYLLLIRDYHQVVSIDKEVSEAEVKMFSTIKYNKNKITGFPGGAVVENLPANAGDTGSSPGLGRSHMPQSS